jgi:1,4-dihydroxy-2-naphthoate octaprenyltransferase
VWFFSIFDGSFNMPTLEPQLTAFPNPFLRYFAATRPAFLSAALVSCLLGLASAHYSGLTLQPTLATVTLLFALVAHAGANVLNDYYDALNGTDAANTERVFPFTGGSRFIQNGVLSAAQTARFGFVLMGMVALAGVWLMQQSSAELAYIGLAGLLIGWAYSAPPLRLNSRGWGELCITSAFLLIVIGADFVQRKGFAAMPIIVGLPYALLATNLLYINQFPDRRADIQAGKLHWVARLELRHARWGYLLIALAANVFLIYSVLSGALPNLALCALLALPLSLKAFAVLHRHAAQPSQLAPAIPLTIGAMLLHGVIVVGALIF